MTDNSNPEQQTPISEAADMNGNQEPSNTTALQTQNQEQEVIEEGNNREETKQDNLHEQEVIGRRNYGIGEDRIAMERAIAYSKANPDEPKKRIAEMFNVGRKSLTSRLNGTVIEGAGSGRKPILTVAEEEIVVRHLLDMAELGFGYDAHQARALIRYCFKEKEIDATNGWWAFLIVITK